MRSIVEFLKSRGSEPSLESQPTDRRPRGDGKIVALSGRRRASSLPPADSPDDTDPGPSAA